jgi:hypothetical protein
MDNVVGTLTFYDESDMKLALDGVQWMLTVNELDNWLRGKVKHESGLNKEGEELEHYKDAYCTVREEIQNILNNRDLRSEI